MNLWRWEVTPGDYHLGVSLDPDGRAVSDITARHPHIVSVGDLWREHASIKSVLEWLTAFSDKNTTESVDGRRLRVPVEVSECWAAGVTYEISRKARREETSGAEVFYDRVYSAERPELFFKAPGARVLGPGDAMGLRRDSRWSVPEPELTLIVAPSGEVFGYTIGNDLSSRDIEGENPLYLPQAKLFYGSASIGPSIALATTVDPRTLTIQMSIHRDQREVFRGEIQTAQMRRPLADLVRYLRAEWPLDGWTALMTGTALVPPAEFRLEDGDAVAITITGIGTLVNPVRRIDPSWVAVP